jgi:hypothetical protein
MKLIPYWITNPLDPNGPLGFGVTAHDVQDAVKIIRNAGYTLPKDLSVLNIKENVHPQDIGDDHVVRQMGPIVVRGIWYPFSRVGVV